MMISPGRFVIFVKFWFFGLGGKRSKHNPKWKIDITSVTRRISGSIWSSVAYDHYFWYTCVKFFLVYIFFFIFSKFWFFRLSCRLWHQKSKIVWQSHASSWISEAIDVWKVTCHPPSRHVVVCNDYSFKNTIVTRRYTNYKLKLKQASKEYQKGFHHKKQERLAKMCFTFILQFHKFRNDFKHL